MTSCGTISLQELTIQPKQARVAGTCADHFFYMDSLCLKLSDNRKEDAMNKKKTKTGLHDTGLNRGVTLLLTHVFPENCLQPVTQLVFCVIGMSPVLFAISLSCCSRCRAHTE